MKKTLAFVLVSTALLALTACAAEPEKPENPYRLKTYTSEHYLDDELIFHSAWEYSYRENGFLYQIHSFTDDEISFVQTYEQDAYGNIVRITKEAPDGTQQVTENNLTLDNFHRILRDESYLDGELFSITEMAYDRGGNEIMLNINRIGRLNEEDIISYVDRSFDKKGNLIEESVRWNHDPRSGGTTTYQYNADSQCIHSESHTADGELDSYIEYSYDDTGFVQTQFSYKADGTPESKAVFIYDEYGNMLSSESYRYQESVPGSLDEYIDHKTTYTYERIS